MVKALFLPCWFVNYMLKILNTHKIFYMKFYILEFYLA
ncbi:hypothetical protein HMPREF1139_1697 [Campylobacter sp. FOBRC14]|nr:hypothetical protein HMPREF1139_1697 [Campylobacter sp. FOBRC14]